MSSPSKTSLFIIVASFFVLPFLASAAGVQTASDFRLSSLHASLSDFSLKNLDERIYAALKNKKSDQTAHFALGPPHTHQCSDGLDNDNNGAADFPDDYPNCASADDLIEAVPQCNDRNDTDGDGGYDYADFTVGDCNETCDYYPRDPDCASPAQEYEGTTQCSDGIDNDGNGLTDYLADPGCDSPTDTSELGTAQCNDGIDNDGDTLTDYVPGGVWGTGDPDCWSYTDNNEAPMVLLPPGGGNVCPGSRCGLAPDTEVTYNLDVVLPADSDFIGNAYETKPIIHWKVVDGCDCTSSPASWWSGTTGAGTNEDDREVTIDTPGSVTYTLTCNKHPSCVVSAGTDSDSMMITPLWSPSFSFSSPTLQVTANDDVLLEWSGNDLKSCTAGGWDGPSASALQVANSGVLGQNQTHSVNLGKITSDKTYTLSCTGFNDVVLAQQTVNATLLRNPTPYFFINGINLIIIGPGSGGRSNKATVGVTPGGGFTGTINLSAARPPALVSANATLHIEPSTVTCNGTSCTTAEFWVETPSDIPENTYTITLTADPVPAGFESKTANIPLRVRRFVPAFEEI